MVLRFPLAALRTPASSPWLRQEPQCLPLGAAKGASPLPVGVLANGERVRVRGLFQPQSVNPPQKINTVNIKSRTAGRIIPSQTRHPFRPHPSPLPSTGEGTAPWLRQEPQHLPLGAAKGASPLPVGVLANGERVRVRGLLRPQSVKKHHPKNPATHRIIPVANSSPLPPSP